MFRLEFVGLLLISCTQIFSDNRNYYAPYNQRGHQRHNQNWNYDRIVKEVRVKQGRLRGSVVQPQTNPQLQLVDVFLGIPYADPPIGPFRFSPPRSPQPWRDVRAAQEFAPVCPQVLPNLRLEVEPGRHEYLERLLPYLRNQSEDCLYLNIYAPHQNDGQKNPRKYPVMVFIHGESYEWNSGNPYDGTVISAYGNVVFVTINFRLGILGFLRPGISDDTSSNFGLLDQTAALLWLRENIAKFGGDPDSVTLVGHGTGAILTNLLLISPVANNEGLFKRAILMSGSALSADAIGKAPLQITKQVAFALNCPTTSDNDLALCLRQRDVESLLNVRIDKPKYVPAFAPLIDRAVIPKKPIKLMENAQMFGSIDLMYGVTESEKFHILPPAEVLHGMTDDQRDGALRDHARATYELEPDLVLSKILEHYGEGSLDEGFTDEYPMKNRDLVLDAMSDSGTVAPLVMTARLHARANPKSYMYVFSHPRAMHDYMGHQRQHTVHGEEIPYILGVPLDGGKYHLRGRYNIGETLFSEAMMTWWCNFAHTGNPNAPRRMNYMTDGPKEWKQYQVDWPVFDLKNETFFNLTIPPRIEHRYRSTEMEFWNNALPNLFRHKPRGPRPEFLDRADGIGKYTNSTYNSATGYNSKYTTGLPNNLDNSYDSTDNENDIPIGGFFNPNKDENNMKKVKSKNEDDSTVKGSSAVTMVIGFGIVFLLINITAFFYLYHRRQVIKSKESKAKNNKRRFNGKDDNSGRIKQNQENLAEFSRKCHSKPDINEVIKNDKAYDNSSNFGRRSKLSRQNSNSTIDTHIKVKEWIQQEIVHRIIIISLPAKQSGVSAIHRHSTYATLFLRCSPRFLRKTRETLQKEHQEKLTKQQEIEEEENRQFEEELLNKNPDPIYDESPLIVRPGGKKSKVPKVSVAIDATPATRTDSILNQIPIELVKDLEISEGPSPYENNYIDPQLMPQVVVIEHHHSRSDPLPMETVFKTIKPNSSTITRTYESDSGSASSLYAKINPKLKTRLPKFTNPQTHEEESNDTCDGSNYPKPSDDDIYGRLPKLTTFSPQNDDINVTCREPTTERDAISPEEALKTIKRRNYPKVLPDIEKRRSLPAPNTLHMPKHVFGNPLKDHRQGPHPSCSPAPPVPPPRIFGTSKSLDLPEEDEPVTTNLHVGPLLKRQDSIGKNHSDTSIIDSMERVALDAQEVLLNHREEYMEVLPNPKCPVHGKPFIFPDESPITPNASKSADGLDRSLGNPNWYRALDTPTIPSGVPNKSLPNVSIGNPNWYKTLRKKDENPFAQYDSPDEIRHYQLIPNEPRIVITPRLDIPDVNQSSDIKLQEKSKQTLSKESLRSNERRDEPQGHLDSSDNGLIVSRDERLEPKIVILPTGSLKQPKIIIKPNTSVQRNRERNIPKVSAIPSPEVQNSYFNELDTKGIDQFKASDKPPIKKKPQVTRIPSFSKRKDDNCTDKTNMGIYPEKVEIVQRINAPTAKVSIPLGNDNKSSIPTLKKESVSLESSESSSNTDSNTNTIKRKPVDKK